MDPDTFSIPVTPAHQAYCSRKADAESARRHEQLMRTELPKAQIPTQLVQTQFASVASAMRCAKDTHVAACAAASLAGDFYPGTPVVGLGTKNIRDVGIRKLARLGIEVQRPDAFFLKRFQPELAAVASAFVALGATLRSTPNITPAAGTTCRRRRGDNGSSARHLATERIAPMTTRSV